MHLNTGAGDSEKTEKVGELRREGDKANGEGLWDPVSQQNSPGIQFSKAAQVDALLPRGDPPLAVRTPEAGGRTGRGL